ncbi:DUF1622 domain-containing protein [Fischerella sp. JS2]|uniref:DUF1622 domain-containing protein n=1 Tax=Fischerella sp. JS2 TaxID=2597771 RepID=UPI0028EDF542|nr:DUF1622 domain-containing protein [Fischerella sp. JS2]
MEWFEPLKTSLEGLVSVTQFVLEIISVLCVIAGLIKTSQLAIVFARRRRNTPYPFNKIRLRFGIWLALALEFQLGADILATTIRPSFEELAKLALIAVVRTLLNYFLGKELETEYELEEKSMLPTESRTTHEDPMA